MVSGGVSPERMGFAYEAGEEIPIFSFSLKLSLSIRNLGCSDAVDLQHGLKEKRETARKAQRCVCGFLCVCVCVRARVCVLMRRSLQLEPRPGEVIGMELLFPPGTRLRAESRGSGGFLVLVVVPQAGSCCR